MPAISRSWPKRETTAAPCFYIRRLAVLRASAAHKKFRAGIVNFSLPSFSSNNILRRREDVESSFQRYNSSRLVSCVRFGRRMRLIRKMRKIGNGQVRKLRGEYVVLYIDESRSQAGKRWSRVNQLTGRKSLLSLFVAPRHPGLDCTFERR